MHCILGQGKLNARMARAGRLPELAYDCNWGEVRRAGVQFRNVRDR